MIEFREVHFSYNDNVILFNADMHLIGGMFYFLTGPSGSGKSTVLKLCYQELLPEAGTIRIFSRDVNKMQRNDIALMRRRIGVVHQDCYFIDHLTVWDNILLPSRVCGRDINIDIPNLHQLLRWVNLNDRVMAYPPELSGGERQRLALARALILSPDIILADEPTGNIDWDMGLRLLQLLAELNKLGKTILLVTHDMNLIRVVKHYVTTRVLRIKGKEILSAGADL